MAEDAKRIRVTFEFNLEAYARFKKLEEDSGADGKATVIRNALRIYEWCMKGDRDGDRFQVVRRDGSVETVELFK